ncbi:MAG TPA: hypothetical protein PLY66_08885 [Acidobacteriota bacterium]|nr:hypothetical protein [Acidobacteriota bacterium]HQF88369.1 hypothetical protein [Acidobacteriota bacterium]HQK86988.1 hypothetical protein [Acidobacteriota bacterium]
MVDRIDGGAEDPSGVGGLNAQAENDGLSDPTTVLEGESRLAQVAERLNIPEALLQTANPGIGLAGEVTAGQELRLPRLAASDAGPGASEPPAIKHEHIGDKRWQGNVWEAKLSARLSQMESEFIKTGAGFEDPLTARPKLGFEDPLTAFPKAPAGFEDPLTARPKIDANFEDPLTAMDAPKGQDKT